MEELFVLSQSHIQRSHQVFGKHKSIWKQLFLQLGFKQSMLSKCVVKNRFIYCQTSECRYMLNFNFANQFKKIFIAVDKADYL